MTWLSRMGLLGAALALPLAAVVVSYASGPEPGLDAPAEVRVGGPGAAVPPLPEAVRVPVVAEQPAEIMTGPDGARSGTVPEPVGSAPPPVVVGGSPGPGKGAAKPKGNGKSRSNSGATPPGRGRAAAGNG
jgi:hypothetical protein